MRYLLSELESFFVTMYRTSDFKWSNSWLGKLLCALWGTVYQANTSELP